MRKEQKEDFIVHSIKHDAQAAFFGDDNGQGHKLGFDLSAFMSEVRRLKLANQQMSITVHAIEGGDESSLYLGISTCRRYRTEMRANYDLDLNVSYYYSADCVWRHLQHVDEAEQVENEAAQRTGGSEIPDLPGTQHIVSHFGCAWNY